MNVRAVKHTLHYTDSDLTFSQIIKRSLSNLKIFTNKLVILWVM
jgi:hypothetical protein